MCYSLSVLLVVIGIQNHGLNDTFAEKAYKQYSKEIKKLNNNSHGNRNQSHVLFLMIVNYLQI